MRTTGRAHRSCSNECNAPAVVRGVRKNLFLFIRSDDVPDIETICADAITRLIENEIAYAVTGMVSRSSVS